jgi:hypothetical protein
MPHEAEKMLEEVCVCVDEVRAVALGLRGEVVLEQQLEEARLCFEVIAQDLEFAATNVESEEYRVGRASGRDECGIACGVGIVNAEPTKRCGGEVCHGEFLSLWLMGVAV